jgi:integrase/recombinase XerD
VPTRAAEPSFESAAHAYFEELRVQAYSKSVQYHARYVLGRLFHHLECQQVTDLRSVSEAHLVDFARHLKKCRTRQGKPLSSSTRNFYLHLVRRFFACLARRGTLLLNPAEDLPLPKVTKAPRSTLSPAQARRLMEAPSPYSALGKRDRAILEILYGTGIRRQECLRVEVSDLDLAERTLLVRNGKGKKDRLLPVPRLTALALDRYLREIRPALLRHPGESSVFLTLYGRPLSASTLRQLVRRHGKTAGIAQAISPHTLRHACATHLLKGGADVRHVQAILGHQHIDTTARYTRIEATDLHAILESAHPRGKLRLNKPRGSS